MSRKALIVALAVAVLVVVVLACQAIVGRARVIKIGVVLPLTGASANHGQDAKDGLELALVDIRKAPPIRGADLRLIFEDNRSLPTDSVSATKKLIEADGVKIIIGPIASSDALAMVPVTEKAGVLLFSPAASSPKLTGSGRLFFRTSLLAEPQGRAAASFVVSKLGRKEAAIFFLNDDTGRGYADSFAGALEKLGGKILVRESYNKTDEDFRTSILKLRTKNARVAYVPAVPKTLGLIVKQSHELGYDPIFVSNYGSEGEDLLRLAGSLANGRVFLTSFRLNKTFVDRYRAKHRKQPGIAAPLGYDALRVLAEAMKRAQSDSPSALARALRSLKAHSGATGEFRFDKNGDPIRKIVFRTVSDGRFKEVRQ